MTPTTPVANLVRAAQRGDKQATAELIARFQPLVWAAARRLSPSVSEVEDLVQEANLALLKAVRDFRPAGGAPFAWYAKRQVYWAVRAAVRELRQRSSREEACLDEPSGDGLGAADRLTDPDPTPEERALTGCEREAVRAAWAELTLRQRQVLAARLQGATFAATAARLGMAPSSAKGVAARGVARLRRLLADCV